MVDPEEEDIITFETSGPILPTTQSHLPWDLNLQHYRWKNIKSRICELFNTNISALRNSSSASNPWSVCSPAIQIGIRRPFQSSASIQSSTPVEHTKIGKVAGGVVSWVYFGFSFFCVNRVTCSEVSNFATVVHVSGKWSTFFCTNIAFYIRLPITLKEEKVEHNVVRGIFEK